MGLEIPMATKHTDVDQVEDLMLCQLNEVLHACPFRHIAEATGERSDYQLEIV